MRNDEEAMTEKLEMRYGPILRSRHVAALLGIRPESLRARLRRQPGDVLAKTVRTDNSRLVWAAKHVAQHLASKGLSV